MEPEGSLPCAQQPDIFPILSQINPLHAMPPYFLNVSNTETGFNKPNMAL